MDMTSSFNTALYGVSERIRKVLYTLPESVKADTEEIRLRLGKPVMLTLKAEPYFLSINGISRRPCEDLLICGKDEINESFMLLCGNSVYAHCEELKNGYIAMKKGHRAGICGTITKEGMRDISSVNIRIARQIFGCANALTERFSGEGILIAGPPASGKTTMLRDTVRQLSNGGCNRGLRVAVIDTRGEISGSFSGECFNDLGANTDVLITKNKAEGVTMALRTMYPDVIAFDEIGTQGELEEVQNSFNAGTAVITTAHIGNKSDIMRRNITRNLLQSGAIGLVAVLPYEIGKSVEILSRKEFLNGNFY